MINVFLYTWTGNVRRLFGGFIGLLAHRRAWQRLVGALVALVLLAPTSPEVRAQTEADVRQSGTYYVGEAQGETLETVRGQALNRLTADIRIALRAGLSPACGEDAEAYPHLSLKDVRYLEQTQNEQHRVVA